MISANSNQEFSSTLKTIEKTWLDQANITFQEYFLIIANTAKDKAQEQIKKASVIFLLGGDTLFQNNLLKKLELIPLIKHSQAVILGTNAGTINMSKEWLFSKYTGNDSQPIISYSGIGLDNFSVLSPFDLENTLSTLKSDVTLITKEMDVYAFNKDCALRVENNNINIFGDIYLINLKEIKKL